MKNNLVSFDDTKTAFQAKSDTELNKAYWLFKIISYNGLVKIAPPFVNFAIKAHLPITSLVKATVFQHFCGGETINECQTTINKLSSYHVGTILDYSVEGKATEKDFINALEETLSTIRRAKGDAAIPFCVFKPTGFASMELLEKVNENNNLLPEDQKEYEAFKSRVELICKTAFENNVPVFIDAEESWIQNSTDEMAREMMMKYNKEKVIIYNTLQMYRHDRLDYLKASLQHASENNYKAGFKIVRGAYMEKERARADKMNYPSPIQPDKAATDRDYDAAIRICVENINNVAICCGSHNEESSLLLCELMNEKGLAKNHAHIWFSQLYGMSDHISYNLATAGYNVCKYVPYGPVKSVLPYLIRRAQENTSVGGQTGRELSLILQEKKRRKL